MRIRKRWPSPLLLSQLPAVRPDALSLTPQSSNAGDDLRLPDLQLAKVSRINGWSCPCYGDSEVAEKTGTPDSHSSQRQQEPPTPAGGEEIASEDKSNAPRGSLSVRSVGWYSPRADTSAASSVCSSLSHSVIGCWCDEDRAFPVKKRRSSFTRMPNKITEATRKRKREKEERSKKSDALIANDEGDMSCTGGIAMQGVRCRRSNGRKWRCWQPSIEGYTHCKYHLDQARVRNRRCRYNRRQNPSQPASRSTELKRAVTNSYIEDDEEYHDREDNDYSGVFEVGKNTRRDVGFGKARSISSLLARTVPLLGTGDSLVQHDP